MWIRCELAMNGCTVEHCLLERFHGTALQLDNFTTLLKRAAMLQDMAAPGMFPDTI